MVDSGTRASWNLSTKVVVCSYGLLVNLIKKKEILPYDEETYKVKANRKKQFKSVIVDESHMLKVS